MAMISTSSGGSSSLSTFSESAIWGTALGDTNETASMCLNPAAIKAFRYSTLRAVGIWPRKPCQESRGHSTSFTEAGIDQAVVVDLQAAGSQQRRHTFDRKVRAKMRQGGEQGCENDCSD